MNWKRASMICISIGERTAEACRKRLRGLECAEVRLDMMEPSELTADNIKGIFAAPVTLIATCRPCTLNPEERQRALASAIDAGAAYVDIEVESDDGYKADLVRRAKGKGCTVIMSYHDDKRTPSVEELRHIAEWCFQSGAEIAKIACRVNAARENARLLGLLDTERKIIAVGMGPAGRITRLLAPLLGSCLTFASVAEGAETAPGQLDGERLARMIREVRDLCGGGPGE